MLKTKFGSIAFLVVMCSAAGSAQTTVGEISGDRIAGPARPTAAPEPDETDRLNCDQFVPCRNALTLDSAAIELDTTARPPDVYVPKPVAVPPSTSGATEYVIGGGFVVPIRKAPWMAQIQRASRLPSLMARGLTWRERQHCSGALIKTGWILTAAHCLDDTLDLKGSTANIRQLNYRVRLGVADISDEATGASYRIVRIEKPTGYKGRPWYDHDIALVQYAADQQTRASQIQAQAIAIDREKPGTRQFGTAITRFYGWGRTERDIVEAPLLFGQTVIAPDDKCREPLIALCGLQIASIGIGGRQSTQCHGDSGGPLVWFEPGNIPVLIGVVSHNVGKATCGRSRNAGVFTRAAAYLSWIEGITGPLPRAPLGRRPPR